MADLSVVFNIKRQEILEVVAPSLGELGEFFCGVF